MLQGSLDNFALDEVLGLLSSTSKTGRLRLHGDRGRGVLTLREGKLVAAEASCAVDESPAEDVVFELLRFERGEFVFEPVEVEAGSQSRDVSQVLAAAESRLVDWRSIEAVVPSPDHLVAPVATLPAEEVKINRAEWAVLLLVGVGCPVADLCDRLGSGELEGSRQIKALAERGLVTVVEGAPSVPPRPALNGSTRAAPPVPSPSAVLEPRPVTALDPTEVGHGGSSNLLGPPTHRPPMPSPPAPEDLLPLPALPSSTVPPPPPIVPPFPSAPRVDYGAAPAARVAAAPPAATGGPVVEDDGRPGGLLMRYLKSDD
ncbi:MAG: DUF4388 domain-containing protein [Acidimicrobiales bacterium]